MQNFLEGLLRSLFHGILQQCLEISGTIFFSWPYNSNPLMDHCSWSVFGLSSALSKLKDCRLTTKSCFFIDSLDEYTGFHPDIISTMANLVSSPNAKVCLSSRPCNVFADAFGGGMCPSLRLQDLTRNDIPLYVDDNLRANSYFIRLAMKDRRYQNFVLEITEKAQGVFL